MIRIASNREGIGSRLKCLLSVMRLAEKNGDKYAVNWDRNKNARCNWSDLFKNDIEVVLYREETETMRYPDIYFSWRWVSDQEEREKHGVKSFDFMYSDTPFKNEILNEINKLIPIDYIENAVKEYRQAIDQNTISVCVRSWKDVRGCDNERSFYIKEFYHEVDKVFVDKIFLTSDDEEIYYRFTKRYGKSNVITYPNRTEWGDMRSVEGIQDALIEMYIPGVASKMITTWHSAYNECQWWFGGAQAEITQVSKWKAK